MQKIVHAVMQMPLPLRVDTGEVLFGFWKHLLADLSGSLQPNESLDSFSVSVARNNICCH